MIWLHGWRIDCHMHPPIIPQGYIATSKADNPSWCYCYDTRGKFADEYRDAMKMEIATWQTLMFGLWLTIMTPLEKHITLSSTWDFKCRWYPDGFIKKFKAQFCAWSNKQLEGTDLFETYATIVQEWTTTWLMFILEILLRLKSSKAMLPVLSFMENLNQVKMFMLKCLWASLSVQRWNQEGFLTEQDPKWTLAEPSSIFGNILPEAWSLWIGIIQIWSLSLCWNQVDMSCLCRWLHLLEQRHIGDQ